MNENQKDKLFLLIVVALIALSFIDKKKGQNSHWTYQVRVVTNSIFSEVWLAEEELLLVEESKRGNRPHHAKPATRLQ